MTKLTQMDLPDGKKSMFFCKECREWVPEERKHNRKKHQIIAK